MVSPVTGPFYLENTATEALQLVKTSWRQQRPYTLPLQYVFKRASRLRKSGDLTYPTGGASALADALWTDYCPSAYRTDLLNKSYDKLKGKIYDTSSWGVDIAERQQSWQMMVTRLKNLRDFTSAVRKLRFGDAARILRLSFIPKGVSKKKAWANNWLEYHFGWEPLIKDIYSTIDVFQSPYRLLKARARSSRGVGVSSSTGSPLIGAKTTFSLWQFAVQGCSIQITNPNLHLADQLGLLNPGTIAWELIPFSFVLDWFTTVGQVISSMTDFAGIAITDGYTTQGYKDGRAYYLNWNVYDPPTHTGRYEHVYACVWVSRTLGLTSPVFSVRPFTGFGIARGATAISLLLQKLR